ncbi:hypothetical protein [Streptomyces tendae]|uniref:hypothetical protein n=1 Tax=Streptomyces tendae TaxID=1932 RepID=UPI00142F06AF
MAHLSVCVRRGFGLVLGGGLDSEDLFVHPLLHGGELVPGESHRLHPPSENLDLVQNLAKNTCAVTH